MPCIDASETCGECRVKGVFIAAVPARVAPAAANSDRGLIPGAAVVAENPDGIMLAGEVSHGIC